MLILLMDTMNKLNTTHTNQLKYILNTTLTPNF